MKRLATALAGATLIVACAGSDCEEACEADNECANGRTLFGGGPCGDLCESAGATAEQAGCTSELDGLMLCRASSGPAGCDDACAAQEDAYSACVNAPP